MFLAACTKVQRAIAVTLTLALASLFKVLRQIFFMLWVRLCQVSYPVWGQVLLWRNIENYPYYLFLSVSLADLANKQEDTNIDSLRKLWQKT